MSTDPENDSTSAVESVQTGLDRLEKQPEYSDFRKMLPEAYLVHAFTTYSDAASPGWEFGFYDKAADKVSVVSVINGKWDQKPPEDVFKEPGKAIARLDIRKAKMDVNQAISLIKAKVRDEYKGEAINKQIIILQDIENLGLVWNITVISYTFHVINFKITAEDGKIVAEQRQSLTMWNSDPEIRKGQEPGKDG